MAKQPTNGDTYETMMERSHEALKKEREDILAKQKEIAEQLEAVDRKLYAYELFDKAIKGEITKAKPPTAPAPTPPPKERTEASTDGTKKPRAPKGKIRTELLAVLSEAGPDGLDRQGLFTKMNATEKSAQQSIDNAMAALRKGNHVVTRDGKNFLP